MIASPVDHLVATGQSFTHSVDHCELAAFVDRETQHPVHDLGEALAGGMMTRQVEERKLNLIGYEDEDDCSAASDGAINSYSLA